MIAWGEDDRSLRLSPTIGDPSGQSPLGRGGAEPAPEGDQREPEVKRLERGRGGEVKRLPGGRDETTSKKTVFADVVITVCVAVAVLVTGCVIYEYHRLDTVMPPGVISALFAFWGGELLIVALRQIFGSDVVTKTKNNNSNDYGGSI